MEQALGGLDGNIFGFPSPGGPFMHTNSMNSMNDPTELFNMMFGNMGGGMHGMPEIRIFHGGMSHPLFNSFQQKPPPLQHTIRISYHQAYTGCTVPIIVERWVVIGDIKVNEEETLYVTIPQGIDDNEMIVLKEKGNAANEDVKGDVKVSIQLHNDTPFKRKGLDLIFKKTISLKESLCGFGFEIPHLNGKLLALNNKTNVNVIKPNYKRVVPGLGFIRNGMSGSLVIEFEIEFPESLTSEQISKLSEILL
jgi:DnaJ-class molecular chaperone